MDAQTPTAYSGLMPAEINLLEPLRRYWGYNSFRPMQERIVRSLIAGKDTCVIMPTGGGKSLCYQLPAALAPKSTAIVVSPLIALMQDQTAQLAQMGIEAAVLNSFVAKKEASAIMNQAAEGRYRLLYLSPERIAQRPTMAWLQHVPVSFFVIDEAHCISEWGHEFRPEYRQLSSLRIHFPDRPLAAFTASATQHVRHDIIEQLKLRDAEKYIASFYRQNLNYIVRQCNAETQFSQLVDAIHAHPEGSIIVYAPTRDGVKGTVESLKANGIDAIGYHGQMEAPTRRRNQEAWMAGDVRVIVGTIAFGLGINKADVRAVIHLSLPKSIEQYYQEAGRGGRDGRPTDCLLLWQPRDAGLLGHFISQIKDAAEKERAWQRYNTIRDFVESNACRHRRICSHFGENTKWESCGACDVCGYNPDWLLSQLPPKPRKAAKSQPQPKPAPVLASIPASIPAFIAPKVETPAQASPDLVELRAYLREWRRQTAARQGIAAFVVMHDTSLDDLCEKRPASLAELRQVFGFGVRKVELYGKEILDAFRQFRDGARAEPTQQKLQTRAAGSRAG
jgi:ATP-dependent DNA helicase RecQ